MKIEGTHLVNAHRTRVYQCLIDPQVLQRCIPGCERLEKTADWTVYGTFASQTQTGCLNGKT
jgi:carbon monoxide dehydrogenase subunit G